MGLNVGLLLTTLRKENGLNQNDVCKSLCAVSNYSKIETGELIPDIFTLSFLCERLGFDTLGLTAYISKADAEYWKWIKQITKLSRLARYEEVEKKALEKPKTKTTLNNQLTKQFELYVHAVIMEKKKHKKEQALEFYMEAVNCTCSELIKEKKRIVGTYGQTELGLALQYLRCLVSVDESKTDFVSEQVLTLINYINTRQWERDCKLKIYSQLTVFWVEIDKKNRYLDSKMFHLRNVFSELRKTEYFYDIVRVLNCLIMIGSELGIKIEIYQNYNRIITEILREFDIAYDESMTEVYSDKMMICIIGKYLKKARCIQNQSQEKISDGICSVESYSRIENGRNIQRRNYSDIANKLNIEEYYYREIVITNNVEVIFLRKKMVDAFCASDITKVEELFEKMLEILEDKNQQYVNYTKARIRFAKKEISWDEFYDELRFSLNDEGDVESVLNSNHSFSITEIGIIEKMAKVLRRKGEKEEAVRLLSSLLRYIEDDDIVKEINYVSVCLIKLNLARYLTSLDEMEKARVIFLDEIREALVRYEGMYLPNLLAEYGYSFHVDGSKKPEEIEKRFLEYGYIFCLLFERDIFRSDLERQFPYLKEIQNDYL